MPSDEDVWYAGDWRAEPYTPSERSWADDSKHVKISNYHVVQNNASAYSWKIETRVTGKDYKSAWDAKPEEITVKVENGCLVLLKNDEETGAYLKLPKNADPNGALHVDKPHENFLFVTIAKKGAKGELPLLSPDALGLGPRSVQDRAPSLEDEYARSHRSRMTKHLSRTDNARSHHTHSDIAPARPRRRLKAINERREAWEGIKVAYPYNVTTPYGGQPRDERMKLGTVTPWP